jgi:O-antigen ligase
LVLALAFFYVFVNVLEGQLIRQTFRMLLLLGGVAAALGVVLYVAPTHLSEAFLVRLGIVGYPTSGVLRYVEDNPELALRAIGTSVDPNVFGGMLAILGGLVAPQLFLATSRRDKVIVLGITGAIGLALLLTYSRGSMFGLVVALGLLGLVRHRRIIWLLLAGLVLVLVLPMTREYVQHFIEGLQGQDLATQMRFGEYKDALLLISRYPWFGVGFTGVPDVDIYLGVSSVYLLIAEEMGLVGVSAFLFTLLVFFAYVWPRAQAVRESDPHLEALMLGTLTGVAAGMVAGVLDHYLFNPAFPHAATFLWLVVALGVTAAMEAERTRTGNEAIRPPLTRRTT